MSEAEIVVRRVGPRLLTDAEQQAYLQFLLKGASPAVICAQLGVPYSAVLATLRECAEFRDDHGDAQALLTQNVEASLYTHAMKGSVPAMTLWLRNRPPNSWKADADGEDAEDYFLAGRNVGWFVIGASLFASNIGSEHLVGLERQ